MPGYTIILLKGKSEIYGARFKPQKKKIFCVQAYTYNSKYVAYL